MNFFGSRTLPAVIRWISLVLLIWTVATAQDVGNLPYLEPCSRCFPACSCKVHAMPATREQRGQAASWGQAAS
jgi:hypothetical protein